MRLFVADNLKDVSNDENELFGGDFEAQYKQALGSEIRANVIGNVCERSSHSLSCEGLTKSFAGIRVLSSVDLAVRRGEVHALIGQNGSGKSTLIKIVSGYHAPDSGKIMMRGEPFRCQSSRAKPIDTGFRFLHQDVGVVRTLTVLENLRVGRYRATAFGRLDWREERRRAKISLEAIGLDVDPDTAVKDVPAAERALIGFARAIQDMDHERGEVLILDEPTAFLPGPSVEKIFAVIREVARRGSAVIFVSHRLDEVMRDLRSGFDSARRRACGNRRDVSQTSQRRLVADMLGRELDALYPPRSSGQRRRALVVENLIGRIASGVSFEAHEGEILGLTGLLGMGHDEVPYLLFGAQAAQGGEVVAEGQTPPRSHAFERDAGGYGVPSGGPAAAERCSQGDPDRECLDDLWMALHGRRRSAP